MSDFLERIEGWARRIGSHPWFPRVVLISAAAATAVLYLCPQPPGVAVACLAVGAIVMTFREMRATHKVLWFAFAVAMVFLEYRSILKDHAENQAALNKDFKAILEDNRTKTQAILDNNQRQFETTKRGFDQILGNITGGKGYLYVIPTMYEDKEIRLAIWNNHPYRISNIDVTVRAYNSKTKNETGVSVGSINAHAWGIFSLDITKNLEENPRYGLWLLMDNGQSGLESERIDFRAGDRDRWAYKVDVERVRLPTTSIDMESAAYHSGTLYSVGWTDIKAGAAPKHR